MPSTPIDQQEMRLDFLGIGVQKSGTTSLNAYLRDHPQIQVAADELHFFDNERNPWPPPNWESYHSRFPDQRIDPAMALLRGEITPIYLYWKPCLERIHAYNPNLKLIVLLRNPISRAYSHWAMETQLGKDSLSFSEAIQREDERLSGFPLQQHRVYSYAARGFYHAQLQRLLEHFPRENLHVVKSEDFFADPKTTQTAIHQFLGLPIQAAGREHHKRIGTYNGQMSLDDWTFLYTKLAHDIAELETLLDWDCSDWKRPWRGLEECADSTSSAKHIPE
jgi:hypothetical protein